MKINFCSIIPLKKSSIPTTIRPWSEQLWLNLRCLDNSVFVIGGIGGKGGTYEKRLDSVECLELTEDGGKRWKQLAAMSTPRSSHTCEVMDGLIYVVGGGDGKDWLCSAEVNRDIFTNKCLRLLFPWCRSTIRRRMFGDR